MAKSIGYIGLGKMGLNMCLRLKEKGWGVVTYNRSSEPRKKASTQGIETVESLAALVEKLEAPRLIWLMISHQAVDAVLAELTPLLAAGDTVIDGGNSPYKETMRRAKELSNIFVRSDKNVRNDVSLHGVHFLDAGVSGGPKGAREGACVMIGGEREIFEKYEQLFRDIAAPDTYAYFGKSGAGHFVKMVHNGIEYGMMQAVAEGFAVMKASQFDLNLEKVADIYQHRSVVESRLVGWLRDGLSKYGPDLDEISGSAAQSGEGLWTVEAAKELGIPVPIIEGALNFRLESQKNPSYTGKVLTTLRNMFGGHSTKNF